LQRVSIEKKVFDISDGWDSAISEMIDVIKSKTL